MDDATAGSGKNCTQLHALVRTKKKKAGILLTKVARQNTRSFSFTQG
jgi:hypothetical protein